MWMELRNDSFSMKFVMWPWRQGIKSLSDVGRLALVASIKVSLFSWKACWGKVLTLDQLHKRGWTCLRDASFIKSKKNQLIIFCFIMPRQSLFGSCSSLSLTFLKFFLLSKKHF